MTTERVAENRDERPEMSLAGTIENGIHVFPVRVYYEDTGNHRVIFNALLQVIKVRVPIVVGVKLIGNRTICGMGGLS